MYACRSVAFRSETMAYAFANTANQLGRTGMSRRALTTSAIANCRSIAIMGTRRLACMMSQTSRRAGDNGMFWPRGNFTEAHPCEGGGVRPQIIPGDGKFI